MHYHRSREAADELVAELDAVRAGSALAVRGDLNDVDCLPALVAQAVARFGRIDVLINNASTFYPTPVGTITAAQFDDLVGTNLRAPLFLSQAAAPALRETRGLIINMVDIHAPAPAQGSPGVLGGKGGARDADEVARARARPGRARERHRARARCCGPSGTSTNR